MIPRHQRTCFTCIYGRLLSDGKTIDCHYNVDSMWVPSWSFCSHGQWEWLSDRSYLYTIKYADEPTVGFTDKEQILQADGAGLYAWMKHGEAPVGIGKEALRRDSK